ncbi:MAG: hypothetical protein Q9225_007644 [Loekoesia sp. 1 TL-2023]
MAEFIRSQHGYEEGWVGRKPLGQGAVGRAGMWEKRDADGNVIDQVCIKQTKAQYLRDYNWRKPSEVKVMEDLRDKPNNGTVQLRGYRRYPRSKAHRIYLEYCEHGNLESLIAKYRRKSQYFPEEFIWDVFYHLTQACRVMALGPSQRKVEYLDTYVHRDIKPENIFLAATCGYDEDGIPIYPTTRLGDFGLTIATGDEDPRNPSELKGAGTNGYRAPEQKFPSNPPRTFAKGYQEGTVEDEITDDSPEFSSKTNVWGVGACIYKLIWLTDVWYDRYRRIKENKETIPEIVTTRRPEYSKQLRDLVRECLRFWPSTRPSWHRLLRRIERVRNIARERWERTQNIPSDSVLCYTKEALDEMSSGTWVKRQRVFEDTPPPSYSSLGDPNSDYP